MTTTVNYKLDTILNSEDDVGNKMVFNDGQLYLKLKGETNARFLGYITEDNGSIKYTKFERESNIMRKNNSWSIAFEILKQVDRIEYKTDKRTYRIDQQTAMDQGSFLHFKNSGYERKIYIPLEHWNCEGNNSKGNSKRHEKLRALVGNDEWFEALRPAITSQEFADFAKWVARERKQTTVYPDRADTFRAYQMTPLSEVRMVFLGQDPYPSDDANGLAFGTKKTDSIPSSQDTIFQELNSTRGLDFFHNAYDRTMQNWANQGALMLNTALTVRKSAPGSHRNVGWEPIIEQTVKAINELDHPVIFMLWGKYAQQYEGQITNSQHKVLKAAHPSAEQYTASGAGFTGCGHFEQINQFLSDNGYEKMNW